MEERSLLNFASNNYLGLAEDDRLIQPAMAATQEYVLVTLVRVYSADNGNYTENWNWRSLR